jgi:CRISPR-associated protein Cmr2
MIPHLLVLAIGPVQEFIAAARRTRDLCFGSQLLSRLSNEAAESLRAHEGVELIFPAVGTDPGNVANVILASVPGRWQPKDVAGAAQTAVKVRWKTLANDSRKGHEDWTRADIWDAQISDVVEFYAAWLPLGESYRETRAQLMRLLAGRKALRDFIPAAGVAGVPKSSLDGARESVIKDRKRSEMPTALKRSLRLSEGEHLDVVGWTKRVGGGRLNYPSLQRLSADPWLFGVAQANPAAWRDFTSAATELKAEGSLGKIEWARYAHFPYEGSIAYETRHREFAKETDASAPVLQRAQAALKQLYKQYGEPEGYLAVLAADGDRMGATIGALDSIDKHQKFSRDLSQFASAARRIVERHYGTLVFSGGDDVLAILPADLAIECARELHDSFGELMEQIGIAAGTRPTLSVGLAFGHAMDPMEDLLEYARAQERRAKRSEGDGAERDGLSVGVYPRSGAPTAIRQQWTEKPDEQLLEWADVLREGLVPQRAAYELRQLAREYSDWPPEKIDLVPAALLSDATRLLKRKRGESGAIDEERLEKLLAGADSPMELEKTAVRLLVARRVARAKEQSGGRKALPLQ